MGKGEGDKLEIETRKDRGGQRVHIPKVYVTGEWRTGGTHKGEGKKSSNSNGTGVENKEIEIWKVMDV